MLLNIPNVLTHDELRQARQLLAEAPWEDGLATAGAQSALVKHNLQLAQTRHRRKRWAAWCWRR